MHIRESLTGTILAGSVALLLAAFQFAPLIPGWEALPQIPDRHRLDYGPSQPGLFEPLSDAFIARALGLRRERARALADSLGTPASSPTRDVILGAGSTQRDRTVVTHPLTNDRVEQAYRVDQIPFTARTNASGASREENEPASCAPTGPTIWYAYRPSADKGLIASTIGTRRPTSLGVFTGTPGGLEAGPCASNVQGNAQVAFPVQANTTYYFQVTTPTGAGHVVFNLDPLGATERVSVNSRGHEANYFSKLSGMSADGRWVVFNSRATNLVDEDTNDEQDVFVHDRLTGETTLASVASDGSQGNKGSGGSWDTITPDGRYVAFYSRASDLVADDGNDWYDVFVHDRRTGKTERVSVSSSGKEGTAPVDPFVVGVNTYNEIEKDIGFYQGVSISADGRFVAFQSALSGLVPHDDELAVGSRGFDGGLDVFVRDRWTGQTEMVSVSSGGANANDWSEHPSMSTDGRYVAFRSFADNLVDGDDNETADVFVHDRQTNQTTRISRGFDGKEADDNSQIPALSATGRYVAFASWASNLVPNDTKDSFDVFLHDRLTGENTRVSVTSEGAPQQGPQDELNNLDLGIPRVAVSADGRFVAFRSSAPNLAPGRDDPPLVQWQGVFVHDRLTGSTIEVSVSSQGRSGRASSDWPVMSADGRTIAFISQDPGLVEDDNNGSANPLIPNTRYFHPTRPWSGRGDDVFIHEFPVLR